jgi:serine/threonine-protein kinase RsbW
LSLAPGSSILLYTDGLVERREQPIMDSLDGLVEQADRHRDSSAATLASAVVDALGRADHADDICLLVVRLAGAAQPE